MQTTKFNDSPRKRRVTKTQAVIYGLMILLTLIAILPYALAKWRQGHPLATTATGAPVTAPTGQPRETLAVEVAHVQDQFKTQGFAWTLSDHTLNLRDVLPVDMADLEKSDVTRNRVVLTQGKSDTLPSLAGAYRRGRVCASDWPRPGSTAVEFLPTMATDPENPAQPWRVVLLYGTSNEATGLVRQAVADRHNIEETISLGRDAQAIPAVPVEKTEADGVTTFYCVCPAQATMAISGVRLFQRIEPVTSPEQETHNRWQTLHDAFLSKARQRANAATTPQEKAQVAQEIDDWKTQHPEPPRPVAAPTPTPAPFQ